MRKPQPRVVSEVCSLCGLDWKRHGANPTAETCVGLLLDEIRGLNARLAHQPVIRPIAYPPPWRPWPYLTWGGAYSQAPQSISPLQTYNATLTVTPAVSAHSPRAIGSGATRP